MTDSLWGEVLWGDCRHTLPQLVDRGVKVQTSVTSPPYFHLRDYGHSNQIGHESSLTAYIESLVEVFQHVHSLTAPTGTLWLIIGDRYNSGSSGSPGNTLRGQGQNQLHSNRHAGIKIVREVRRKELMGIPWRVAFALQDAGWFLRRDIIWYKPNVKPESVKDRPTTAHEYVFLFSKGPRYLYDGEAIKEPAVSHLSDKRYLLGYDRDRTHEDWASNASPQKPHGGFKRQDTTEGRNRRSVWTIPTVPYRGSHFAVAPPQLVSLCLLASSRYGDTVLDPFFGSGTTGQVAQDLERKWIGCEVSREYEALQRERTAQLALPFQQNSQKPQTDDEVSRPTPPAQMEFQHGSC